MRLLRTLFSFSGTIGRAAYVLVALCGALVKHALDLGLAIGVFHRPWGPLNYLVPLGAPVPLHALDPSEAAFVGWMLIASIPFAWVGLAITAKRFRTIGWPAWSVMLFFIPIANLASFAVAAAWPEPIVRAASGEEERAPRWLARLLPRDGFGIATVAIVAPASFGLVLVAFATQLLQSYGWALFAAVPFAQGAIAAVIYGSHRRRTVPQSVGIAILSSAIALLGLLAVALEGGVCILMATPIVIAMAAAGALLGHVMQSGRRELPALAVLIAIAPAIMGAEAVVPRETPTYMVRSEVVVDAPPSTVWRHVIAFPDLPPPTALPFRIGIAYPERARIVGRGVGAIRYCEFSTGDFVEPVTAWEPGKRLAFRVARSAEPMREWSPYAGIDPPHLHGYMVSKHGEFDLEPLPGGRTRLIGITWYQHRLWPASYWALYSDAIVHQIHLTVLDHVKRLSEADRRNY